MTWKRWVAVGFGMWALAAVFVLAMSGAAAPAWDGAPRELTASIPATALRRLTLDAREGRVEISNGLSDTVEIRVTVRPSTSSGTILSGPAGDPGSATLDATPNGATLNLAVRDAHGGRLHQSWVITAPARLALKLDLGAGQATVTGFESGVTARVGAGSGPGASDLTVTVPRGPLDLSIGVGDIRATTDARALGEVSVASSVGDAALFIDGQTIDAPHAPGPGHRIRLAGGAGDTLKLRAEVGDATLRIR